MEVTVITRIGMGVGITAIPKKTINLEQPGNRKWLMSHIRWAAKQGHEVTIASL